MDDPATSSAPPADTETTGDILYDAFYGAAIGGATIALFFLVVDSIQGRPMFTPSLLGVVFVVLTGAFFLGDFLLIGGAAAVIGFPSVLVANFLTALAMGVFLRKAHA